MSKINDNSVERDMTDAEQAEYDAWAAQMQTVEAAQADAVAAKEATRASGVAKLEALGLTVDEVSAVFGV
jgi:hypothetical protein